MKGYNWKKHLKENKEQKHECKHNFATLRVIKKDNIEIKQEFYCTRCLKVKSIELKN